MSAGNTLEPPAHPAREPADTASAPPAAKPAVASHRCGFVAIVGRTNVGKSTLLNRLVGEHLAIVSPVPQTTRHRVLGVKNVPGGQILYVDTPGFHKPRFRLNRDMLGTAEEALRDADVLLCIIDASEGVGPGDRFVFSHLRDASAPVVLALNKIDLMKRADLLPLIDAVRREGSFAEIVPISASEGTQCDLLEEVLLRYLPEHPPLYPPEFLTDQPERLLAAELIREQVLLLTREEIPHAVAVSVDRFAELADGGLRIDATLYVERDSQKGILVGRSGQMLKEIGSRARVEITRVLGRPTSVFLWVKVQPDWRDDPKALARLRPDASSGG